MRKRFDNILIRYTLISFAVVLGFSLSLGILVSRQITDHIIQSHIRIFPLVVNAIARNNPSVKQFFLAPPGTTVPEDVQRFLDELHRLETVFRVKLWGADAVVHWSDNAELIGRKFDDNNHYRSALLGEVVAEVEILNKEENLSEQGHGSVLEIYIPVEFGGEPLGVVELYESDHALFRQIGHSVGTTWWLIGAAGATLYALLFLTYYRAHVRQKWANAELLETQNVTISALAHQAEIRDLETGLHLDRTSRYVQILAAELRGCTDFKALLTPGYISALVKSTPLHDIGKVGIPDHILRKPGSLSPEEFGEIQKHCENGAAILRRAEKKLSSRSFLSLAIDLVLYHHEKWDGTGYPHGLKEEQIPLAARIMALADVYDALRSPRYYKAALSHARCLEIIRQERGVHFDPRVVDAFLARHDEFRQVSEEWADTLPKRPVPRESSRLLASGSAA
ncbi:hypothetical protein DESUT3_04770 [Desulfuromonas versatilis]|uniref:HD-GYP domain-containing protein n=1 Tax=Desulfuromonas versatilis TaxID=2802975 RepID=A0ABN6DTC4_9BACT|nr:HD domain-containing phosphohydrolase [Desulfuromonas versatilis]BCR03408.1 hypothetical protein DESUT3_04770 [Desulfuromonas versatilis]